jgi:hypothetical protein
MAGQGMADADSPLHPFRDLYDAAIRHSALKLVCGHCRHVAVFQLAALWWHFKRSGRNDHFDHVQRRLFCLPCWHHRGVKERPSMSFCDEEPTDTRFSMPSVVDWKQEARRRR